MNLTDACILRSNELTRELAGCLAIDPLFVLPLLEKLKPDALTDETARRYILAVKTKLSEIQDADDYHQADMVVQIAKDEKVLMDYFLWITMPRNIYQDAPAAIKELQGMAITQNTLAGLQEWIGDLEELNEWH